MSDETTPLRDFLELVEASLNLTEPTALDDCSVASVSPVKGGLVGLDVNTGRPVQVGWKYKTIDEKPVIINAGGKQTIIPPKPAPPPPEPVHIVDVVMAGALYTEMRARFQPSDYMTEVDVGAKNAFIKGCLTNPSFFVRWRSKLDVLNKAERLKSDQPKPLPPCGGWPSPPRARQRIVDT
jgi:hypothetical protein